jgi:hypothetical protein
LDNGAAVSEDHRERRPARAGTSDTHREKSRVNTFVYPYPEMLTRKDWDKRKSLVVRISGATGVGDQCDKLAKAYQKVNWKRLNAYDRRSALGKWNDDDFCRGGWDQLIADAMVEVDGSIARVSVEAFALSELCRRLIPEFKASRTIPATATQHVTAMAKAAYEMGQTFNKKSMTALVNTMTKAFLGEVDKKFVMRARAGARDVAQRHKNVIAELRNNPTPSIFNKKAGTAARDLTTIFGSLKKAHEKGFAPANNSANQFFAALTPWANSVADLVPRTASPQEVLQEIARFERVFTPARRYAETVK